MHTLKKIVIAIAAILPAYAMAHDSQESKAGQDALKEHIRLLEARLAKIESGAQHNKVIADKSIEQAEQANAEARKSARELEKLNANSVDASEFNRLRIKAEAQEDAAEVSGFKNLKFSGYIDPTYIYNRNAGTASFAFLNNNSPLNGSSESYSYDNTFFGSGMLNLEKEMEGGSKFKFTLMPGKGFASGYNFGNLVHEMTASIPLGTQATRLLAGQFADWGGYEYIAANQNRLITHNLLFDFSAGSFYTGADANCPDGRNGFGSSMQFDGSDWIVADPSRGSNRSALAFGLNYALLPGVSLKGEVRYDRPSGRVFKDADARYRRDNRVIALSTVVSF